MLAFLLSLAALIGGYFIYYLLATMFPIDKLIGNIYPLFALVLQRREAVSIKDLEA